MLPDDMFLNLIDTNLQEKIAMSNDLDGNAVDSEGHREGYTQQVRVRIQFSVPSAVPVTLPVKPVPATQVCPINSLRSWDPK